MNFISKLTKFVAVVFLGLGLVACSDDDDGGDVIAPDNTIADFVATNNDYSSLAAALEVAGLTATLDGSTNYTVFAPNNAAFNAFLSDNGFDSLGDVPVDLLREVLLNHVQMGEILAGQLSTGYIKSMATGMASNDKLDMYINTENGVMINGVATVTSANVMVDNGVIHAVDAVIGLPSVATFAIADPTFDVLQQALTREDDYPFVGLLMAGGDASPFTVFAPTNDAFASLLDELGADNLDAIDADVLASVLSYHVVAGANVTSGDLTDGMDVTTFETGTFMVNLGDDVTIIDENGRLAKVIVTDVQADNGIIHVVDRVLLPENENITIQNIAKFVAGNANYSSLLAALEKTGLTNVFRGTDNYTVFAPDNDAFARFLNGASLDDVDTDMLRMVLMNHVQSGLIPSTDLTSNMYIESMAAAGPDGENLSMYINVNDGVMINGVSEVVSADNNFTNGIVHAVNEVIGLPDVTVFAIADPMFSSLVTALSRENLVETLQTSGEAPSPFTIFAPTNDAFAAFLGDNTLDDVSSEDLTAVLKYHVVPENNISASEITDGATVATLLEGQSLTLNLTTNVEIVDGDDTNENAIVIAADVQATNGIIHAIDGVLVPASN